MLGYSAKNLTNPFTVQGKSLFAIIKSILRPFIPRSVLEARRRLLRERLAREHDAIFLDKNPRYIFSEIYARALWGKTQDSGQFSSGHGSHLAVHVEPYVTAVSGFLRTFEPRLNIVDLGCGDFNVGCQIRQRCAKYVACDVVPALIERNKEKFRQLDVDFRCVDIIEDPLPEGDVVIIRQVLQHLSNEHVERIVRKLHGYKYLILTEFVPEDEFIPNLDQPTGICSRLARGIQSGIVLTKEPFSLKVKNERTICTTREPLGLVITIVYEMLEDV